MEDPLICNEVLDSDLVNEESLPIRETESPELALIPEKSSEMNEDFSSVRKDHNFTSEVSEGMEDFLSWRRQYVPSVEKDEIEDDDPDAPTIKFTEDIEMINEKADITEETDGGMSGLEECPPNELPSAREPKKMTVSGTGAEFENHLKLSS